MRERKDAARNREALLCAARKLVERDGVAAVTMDAVAEEAGVGKGTVFRRFESRAGLMAALVNDFEVEWQAAVLTGPPPLGPGASAMDRLLAMGRARMEVNLTHAQLMDAAGCSDMLNGTVKPMCSSGRSGSFVGEGRPAGKAGTGETGDST